MGPIAVLRIADSENIGRAIGARINNHRAVDVAQLLRHSTNANLICTLAGVDERFRSRARGFDLNIVVASAGIQRRLSRFGTGYRECVGATAQVNLELFDIGKSNTGLHAQSFDLATSDRTDLPCLIIKIIDVNAICTRIAAAIYLDASVNGVNIAVTYVDNIISALGIQVSSITRA